MLTEFPHTLNTLHSRRRRRVGLIVLKTDETVECESRQTLAARPDIDLLHTRIMVEDTVSVGTLTAMKDRLRDALALFPDDYPFDAIGYACTSATTLIGEAEVEDLIKSAARTTHVTNPLTAIKAALADCKAKRIAYLSPYTADIAMRMCDALTAAGVNIAAAGTFSQQSDKKVAAIDERSIDNAVRALTQKTQVDAVFIACTNIKTYSLLPRLRDELNIPVWSSNSALLWHLQRLIA